jgi:hypothetical protein
MTDANLIWNRATTLELDGARERGDRHLWALLRAHGLAMNGGVLHAVEILTGEERASAQDGYRFFGFGPVADLLEHAYWIFKAGGDLELHESQLDAEYSRLADDTALYEAFEEHFRSHPSEFAPL